MDANCVAQRATDRDYAQQLRKLAGTIERKNVLVATQIYRSQLNEIVKDVPALPTEQLLENLPVDEFTNTLVPSTYQSTHRPLVTTRNGNCLFNAASLCLTGECFVCIVVAR